MAEREAFAARMERSASAPGGYGVITIRSCNELLVTGESQSPPYLL